MRLALDAAGLPVRNLRVRDLGDRARIEVDADLVDELARRPDLTRVVAGFEVVEVDPRGFRSGSMNELLPDPAAGQSLTAVCHLPYYGKNPIFHPYDRSGKSRASIPYSCGQYYVAGGLNGGTAAAYLALCRELKKRTDEDLQNNVIARFHDESQLNRLVAETPGKFRILPPDYCTPEETPTGHEAILVLQKSRCINVESVKGAAKPQNFVQRKWEAFRLNWLPYLWLARDTLLRRRIDFKNDL